MSTGLITTSIALRVAPQFECTCEFRVGEARFSLKFEQGLERRIIAERGTECVQVIPVALNKTPVTINQDMKALVCGDALAPRYLQNLFEGIEEYAVSLADSSAHGTRKLDTAVLGRLAIPVPPVPEQKQIASYITDTTARIDALQSAITRSMRMLTERREALVSAVVTGQKEVIR